jgi:hypothetical protein
MTAQEPLREGEIVTLEKTTASSGYERFERLVGPVTHAATYSALRVGDATYGTPVADDDGTLYPGWTIVERRDPEPEWADADAILVDWPDGEQLAYSRRVASYDFVAHWVARLRDAEVTSIRGLYLRPTDD